MEWRRRFAPIALAMAVVLALTVNASAQLDGARVSGTLIVEFADGVVPVYTANKAGGSSLGVPSLDVINAQYDLQSFYRLFPSISDPAPPEKGSPLARYHVLKFSSDADLDAAAAAYAADPTVSHVEFDYYALMNAIPNDPRFPDMWNLMQASDHDVDAEQAWDVARGAPTVVLGVTDTGVLYDHEDLAASIWVNPGEDLDGDGEVFDPDDMNGVDDDGNGYVDDVIGWDFVVDGYEPGDYPVIPGEDADTPDNDPKDFHGHGSHTSGTIAAATNNGVGVSGLAGGFGPGAPGCKIMCLRMGWSIDYFGSEVGITKMSYVAAAFVYAADMGARAVNYSYGSGTGGGIEAATDYAVANGVVICASAGNSNSSSGFGYLQSRSDVITVASTDEGDAKSSFSNYGPLVDISAPGSNIWSTVSNHYAPGYASYSGTSMATPHVVGLIGLMLSANPGLTRTELLDIMSMTADPTTNYVGDMGAGRINAFQAVLESSAFRISHEPYSNTSDTINPYPIVAHIVADTSLNSDSLSLFYRTSAAGPDFTRVPLSPTGNPDEYSADIPAQSAGTTVEYGLTAENDRGDRVTSPNDFPTYVHSFHVLGQPVLEYYPFAFDMTVESGHTYTTDLVVRNAGNDDLEYQLQVGIGAPPPTSARTTATIDGPWECPIVSTEPPVASSSEAFAAALPLVVSDPEGDDVAAGAKCDILEIRGEMTDTELVLRYVFTPSSDVLYGGYGWLALDTDRDPSTGVAPPFGKETQLIGAEYYGVLRPSSGVAEIYDASGIYVGSAPITVSGSAYEMNIPLSLIGSPTDAIHMSTVNGETAPSDWAPDTGFGLVTAGLILVSADPEMGSVPPGDSAIVKILFDARPLHQDTTLYYTINLTAQDSVGSDIDVPVTMHVLAPQYYVDATPASDTRVQAAGDTIFFDVTLTNFGANSDSYDLLIDAANWPTEIWDSSMSGAITQTPALASTDQYRIHPRVIVPPGTAYGESDTLDLTIQSLGDAGIFANFTGATISAGTPDSIPWGDSFLSTTVDTIKWKENINVTIDDRGIGEPSPPYALNLNGDPSGDDAVTSAAINLSGQVQVAVSYWYEQTGGGESPDSGDDLIFEFKDNTGNWVEFSRQLGSGPNMTSFQPVEVILPTSAYHADFHLRIRATCTSGPYDDWFVDDILIYAPIPPSICYDPDAFSFALAQDDSTFDTLTVCNDGPGDLKFSLSWRDDVAPLAGTAFPRLYPSGDEPQYRGNVTASGTEPTPPIADPVSPAGAQQLGLVDDFEDGNYDGWQVRSGAYARSVTSETAAAGTQYSFTQVGGFGDHYDGVAHALQPDQYNYVGFYVRSGSTMAADGYVVIGDANTSSSNGSIFFLTDDTGHFVVYPSDASFGYEANRWYHVEFLIDWPTQTFDYYVDGALIAADLSFRNPATEFSEIHLYNYHSSMAWWDQITVGSGAVGDWLSLSPVADTIAPGETTFVAMRVNTTSVGGGDYRKIVNIQSNDPYEPSVDIPVDLHVTGPEIVLTPDHIVDSILEDSTHARTVWAHNIGEEVLLVSSLSMDVPWLSTTFTGAFISPGDSASLEVIFGHPMLIAGDYTGHITVYSNDFDEGEAVVPVDLHVGPDPDIWIHPESLVVTMDANDSSWSSIMIGNSGLGTLAFWATIIGDLGAEEATSYPDWYYDDVPKGASDTRIGTPRTNGFGGPDSAGYRWRDSDEPDGPTYDWIDISSTGTLVTGLSDDNFVGPFAIGFSFPFYDSTFDEIYICSNGFVGFGPTDSYYSLSNNPMPSPSPPNNIIAWFWDDLYPYTGTDPTEVYFASDGNELIIQFDRMRPCCGSGPWITAELILKQNGTILIQYREVQSGFYATSSTIGIEDRLGETGLEVAFNTAYVHDSLAVRIARVPDWLQLESPDGNVRCLTVTDSMSAEGVRLMRAGFFSSDLPGTDFFSNLLYTSNDPDEDSLIMSVHLHIRSPEIRLNPTGLSMDVNEGSTSDSILWIVNEGESDLHADIYPDVAWLLTLPSMVTVPPVDSVGVIVRADASGLLPGNYAGSVTVLSDDFDEPSLTVPVGVHVGPDPDIAVDPMSLSATLGNGDSTSLSLEIQNTGAGTLAFSLLTKRSDSTTGALVAGWQDRYEPIDGSGEPSDLNTLGTTGSEPVASYTGDYLSFGISNYGEIMPFQFPVGTEHLQIGAFVSGFCVAYRVGISDFVAYASYDNHMDLLPMSSTVIEDSPSRLEVEVNVATFDSLLQITRHFWFDKQDQYIQIRTTLHNAGSVPLSNVVCKSFADWDVDGSVSNDWDFDPSRLMAYAYESRYLSIVPSTTPAYMDIDGWNDYQRRETDEGHPPGYYASFDGLLILHYELGDLMPAMSTDVHDAFVAGASLADLQAAADRASITTAWLSLDPLDGTIAPYGSTVIDVTMRAMNLSQPEYFADIEVTSNDPDENPVIVPAHLSVMFPDIEIRPSTLAMEADEGNVSDSTLWVLNSGAADLHVLLSTDQPWLLAIPDDVVVTPSDSVALTVRADAASLYPGDYTAHLTLQTNDYDEKEVVVPVDVHVGPDPDIAVTPDSIGLTLTQGDSTETALTLDNLGAGSLVYSVAWELGSGTIAAHEPYPASYFTPLAHDAPDNRVGAPVTQGSGGPDSAGYRWIDSDEPGGPPFNWLDISVTGTPVTPLNPDSYNGPFSIGFDFPYYDSTYDQFWISTKGFIGFGPPTSYGSYTNMPIPYSSPPNNIICWYWDDLYPASGANPTNVYYQSEPDRLIVEFRRYRHWSDWTGPWITGEIILYRNGAILTNTLQIQPGFYANDETVGIENITGTDGLEVAFNTAYIHDSLAILYTPTPPWLSVAPTSGVIPGGGSGALTLTVRTGGLTGTEYFAHILITSNDPDATMVHVPVVLTVTPSPTACRSDNQADLNGDGTIDATDLSAIIDVLFFKGIDPHDPGCPTTRSDFDNSGFVDAQDLNWLIDYLFFGGSGPCDPCNPVQGACVPQ